jgi:hypothetical protein
VGVAGVVSLLLTGVAGASGSAADIPSRHIAPPQEITLSEEEIADVTLATLSVFDKENARTPRLFNVVDKENARAPRLFKVAGCRGCGRCRGA